ncbi:MAG: FHA domain-containing protein [Myxococcales bacterium]|nr:FHA domain-containing protein [Myxococcales bacterium]
MGVRLTVKQKGKEGAAPKTVMLDEDAILLGRDQHCQVVLAQQAVSRNHARITRDGTLFFVEDLGSSYGTQINGQKLPKGEKRLLRNGDTIEIAQFDVVFDRVADVAEDVSGKTMFVSRKVVKDVMKGLSAGGEQPYFRVMNGPREGQRIEMGEAQEYVFGRDETADIVLNDDLVSRRHAKVRRDWSGTHVEDLESRNGIKVNKKRAKKQTLKDRDEVEIGGVRLLYIDPTEVRETPVVVSSSGTDDDEGTLSVKQDPNEAPAAQGRAPNPPPEEPPPEAPPAEEPPPEAPSEEASAEEPPPDEAPPDEPPMGMMSTADAPEEGTGKLIDFSNKQTLIALGVGAVMLLFGIVILILLIAGA